MKPNMSKTRFALASGSLLAYAVVLAAAAPAPQASAQVAGKDSAAESSNTVGEVVITALRRDTKLQKTPLSVTALSGSTLAKDGIEDMAGLEATVPSFTIEDNGPGERRPVIRGIEGAGEPTVGIYYDDFPVTGTPGTTNDAGRFAPDLKLYDMDRVEVLKGPQGTLFGSGSMGGTLRYITKQPDLDSFGGYIEADANSVSHGGVGGGLDGVVNLPLISDHLGVRVLAYDENVAGYIDDVALGVKDINQGVVDGFRVSALFQPADRLTISGLAIYQDAHYNAGSGAFTNTGLKSDYAVYDPLNDRDQLYGVKASYDLGFATVTADVSDFSRNLYFSFPFAGIPIPFSSPPAKGVGLAEQPQLANSDTYELRLTSNSKGPFVWTVGVFDEARTANLQSVIPFAGPTGAINPALPVYINRFVYSDLEQTAVFGEASYTAFDKLTLTLGARAFDYKVGTDQVTLVNAGGSPGTGAPIVAKSTESGWVPKVNLSYQATSNFMAYVQYNQGFRPGGANQINEASIPAGYASDTVQNYEVGEKSDWFDHRLTLNAAVYHEIWDHIQVSAATPDGLFVYVTNAGQALVDGVELEANASFTSHWTGGLSVAYTDARLSEGQPYAGSARRGLSGNTIPAVPMETVDLYSEYKFPVGALQGAIRADYKYVSQSQNEFNPDLVSTTSAPPGAPTSTPDSEFAKMAPYSTVNVSGDLSRPDHWKLSLYVENLFDVRGQSFVLIDAFHPAPGLTYYIQPRTIGLKATTNF